MSDRFAKNNQKKSMIFDTISTHLFVFEQSGACVDVNIDSAMAIQLALAFEGGYVKFHSAYMDHLKSQYSWMDYYTPCRKIKLSLQLNTEDLKHNIEFFGGRDAFFDEPIKFVLEGNKFNMP